MGAFSELSIDDAAEKVGGVQEVAPFTLEQSEPEPVNETFSDEEKQVAEAESAQAVLELLKQKEADDEASKEPAEPAVPADELKRRHEEQEAKRKAEWEAKQAAKQEAELMAWENAVAVSDEELAAVSMKRVGTDAERITRRNMKNCVTEHIQTKCLEDMDFARQVMHPRKNMIRCFKYINRMAFEYVKQEMEDNDIKPNNNDGYGCDVPDDLCYQWAEEYFYDLDAKEDKDKDEQFVPKPYTGPSPKKSKKAASKKPEKKVPAKTEEKADTPAGDGQMSLLGGLAG